MKYINNFFRMSSLNRSFSVNKSQAPRACSILFWQAIIIAFLFSGILIAEDNPTRNVVSVSFSPDKIILNHGDSIIVKAKLNIQTGYHVYIGKKNPKSKNVITSFASGNPQFSIITKKIPAGDNKSDPDSVILNKEGTFELEIFDISAKQKEFSGSLNILVKTQVCNEKMVCFKPTTLEEKVNLELKGNRKVAANILKSARGESSKIQWKTKYEDAVQSAKERKQNIYVVVTAPAWCGACRYLEKNTFTDSRVYGMLNKSFVTLYVDYDSSPDAGRFTTDGVPGNFILDETGNQVFSEAGAYPPDSFISVFQPYAKDPTTPKVLPVPPPIPDKNDELNQDNSDNKDMEKIVSEFDEGGRFQVKNVNIQNKGNVFTTNKGGRVKVSMDIKHDCSFCGNAVNQIIVGLAGEDKAQESVWNGKQRSGGELKIVNNGTSMVALAEDNEDSAEWVKVFFTLKVPSKKGIYYIRTRYAQDYQGKVLTKEGLKKKQPDYPKVLDWWKVDRPNGPDSSSNIGAIVVE